MDAQKLVRKLCFGIVVRAEKGFLRKSVGFLNISICLLMLSFVLSDFGAKFVQAQEKPIELIYGSTLPESHYFSSMERLWAKEIEKRTNGRVKVSRYHYAGTVCGSFEQLGCIGRGLIDIGFSAAGYNPAELRLTTLSEMIYISDVIGSDTKARVNLYETFPAFRKEFHDAGVEILTFHPNPSVTMCFSKRKAINNIADLKGVKSQALGPMAQFMMKLGMVPVSIPVADFYESLSRGIIDGLMCPLVYLAVSKLYNIVGTSVDPGAGVYACVFFAMNKSRYDSLPKDIQKIIGDLRQEQVVPETKIIETFENEAIATLKREAPHLNYLRFSQNATALWRQKTEEIFETYIKEREARSPQAREFFRKYLELTKKFEPELKQYYKSPFEKLMAKTID